MNIPNDKTHKPVIVVENYNNIDGSNDPNSTDAMGLSLGLSTWDSKAISVKVWRYPKERWSRMSEELPLHRALDLGILVIASSLLIDSNSSESISNLKEIVRDKEKIKNTKIYFDENRDVLIQRVKELKRVATLFLDNNK